MRKRIVSIVLAGVIGVATVLTGVGCGEKKQDEKTLEIKYFESGYGVEYIEALAEDFMSIHEDVMVVLKSSESNANEKSKIMSGADLSDLYFIETGLFGMSSYLENLTELFQSEVYGEDITIYEKLASTATEQYNPVEYYNEGTTENPEYYILPQTNMYGYNWTYNKTLLDDTFGEGNYELPRTTDEFLDFGTQLQNDYGIDLTASAFGSKNAYEDYIQYALGAWFAQMTGYEGFEDYYNGYYKNSKGELVLADDKPDDLINANRTAIEETFALARELCKTNYYITGNSINYNYKDVDNVYYGGKFNGVEQTRFAFHYTGIWLESEMKEMFKLGIGLDQEIVAMKMPVISAITQQLEDKKMTDERLSAVIKAIDEGKDYYADDQGKVSKNDFNRIKEARNMSAEIIDRSVIIPKSAENKELAKEFVCYLLSDRAQKVAAQHTNGVSVLPYGYEPTDEDMGFAISPYIKSVVETRKETVTVDISKQDMMFAQCTELLWYGDNSLGYNALPKYIFTNSSYTTSAEEIVQKTIEFYAPKWADNVKTYKTQMGISEDGQ